MKPSRLTSALRDPNSVTALESTNATSGAVPPATWVISLVVALPDETAWNSTLMLGCSFSKSFTNCCICGESPTHEEKVIVTGLVGSVGVLGVTDWPGALLPLLPPPRQAVETSARTATVDTPRQERHGGLRMLPPSLRPFRRRHRRSAPGLRASSPAIRCVPA